MNKKEGGGYGNYDEDDVATLRLFKETMALTHTDVFANAIESVIVSYLSTFGLDDEWSSSIQLLLCFLCNRMSSKMPLLWPSTIV